MISLTGGLANFVPWVLHFDWKLSKTVQWIKAGLRETHEEYRRVTTGMDQLDSNVPMNMTKEFLLRRGRFDIT